MMEDADEVMVKVLSLTEYFKNSLMCFSLSLFSFRLFSEADDVRASIAQPVFLLFLRMILSVFCLWVQSASRKS